MVQKRGYDRISMPGTVFILIDLATHEYAQAALEELSSKGLSFISSKSFEVGSSVVFELLFDFLETRYSCKGTIRDVTTFLKHQEQWYRIGLELGEFDHDMFRTIMSAYTSYKNKMPPPARPSSNYF